MTWWNIDLQPDERQSIHARHVTIVIAGEEWEAFKLDDDPEWFGWERFRVGQSIVYKRQNEAQG